MNLGSERLSERQKKVLDDFLSVPNIRCNLEAGLSGSALVDHLIDLAQKSEKYYLSFPELGLVQQRHYQSVSRGLRLLGELYPAHFREVPEKDHFAYLQN